jgi:hypothetical protein
MVGGVPEPSSWAMLIGGFGMTGAVLRRRKTAVAALTPRADCAGLLPAQSARCHTTELAPETAPFLQGLAKAPVRAGS